MPDAQAFLMEQLSFGNAVGHLTYLLLVLSMLMRDMVWLRTIAIGSALLKIYYRLFIVPDPLAVFWETLFVLVNVGQLFIIWWMNARSRFNAHERYFIEIACPHVSPMRARKLIACGTWHEAPENAVLIRQDQPVASLIFLADGQVAIVRDGETVAHCGRGDFLGEMSFVTGHPATATARTTKPSYYLALDQERMRRLVHADPELRQDLQQSFSRNLIDKLSKPQGGEAAHA